MLKLSLFGHPEVSSDGVPVQFRGQTEKALLMFLAHSGETHSREAVADLLWEARTTQRSLANLRTVLARLRKRVGSDLIVTRKTIAYAPEAHARVNSVHFLTQLETIKTIGNDADAILLQTTLQLYSGEFLDGFYLPESPRFNEWIVIEQELLRRKLFAGYERLLNYALANNNPEIGIDTANEWLVWDPYNEVTHRHLLQLLALTGQVSEALAAYETFATRLENDIGVMPQPETIALHDSIQRGEITAPTRQPAKLTIRHNFPRHSKSIFGRKSELATLSQVIQSQEHALITLVGMGGNGKTRLAIELAEQTQRAYQNGIWFIPLADVDANADEAIVVRAIAAVLGLHLTSTTPDAEQLSYYLSDRQILLVLDNCEHVLEAIANLVEAMLDAAGQLNILATSREPLGFQHEYLFRLEGLSFSNQEESDEHFAAMLFADRAQLSAEWQQDQQVRQAVHKICAAVEGSPLAIELAATWTRRLPLDDIAASLEQNPDRLESQLRGGSERHRSVRIVFEGSWGLLSENLQQTLAKLTVFKGGWTVEAAAEIAAVTDSALADLFEKSLLRRDESWRYDMHALIATFSAEKQRDIIPAETLNALKDAHAHWYLTSLAAATDELRGSNLVACRKLWNKELANIQLAWRWALERRQWSLLLDAANGLATLMLQRGTFSQGESLFVAAIESLNDKTDLLRLAQIRIAFAPLQAELGQFQAAIDDLKSVLNALENARASDDLIAAVSIELGMLLLYGQIDFQQAQSFLERGLSAELPPRTQARSHLFYGFCNTRIGKYDNNAVHYQTALTLFREHDDRKGEVTTLQHMGFDATRQRKRQISVGLLEQARTIAKKLGMLSAQAAIVRELGSVYGALRDYIAERDALSEAVQLYLQLGQRHELAITYGNMGVSGTEFGDYANALKHYQYAIKLARELNVNSIAWTLNNMGLLYEHLGEYEMSLAAHTEAVEQSIASGSKTVEAISYNRMGQAYSGLQQYEQAIAALETAATIQRSLNQDDRLTDTRCTRLEVAIAQDDATTIAELVEPMWAYLQEHQGNSLREPLRAYLSCYQGLRNLSDKRANPLLEAAIANLEQQAAKIVDLKDREMYLENIPAHRQLRRESNQAMRVVATSLNVEK